MFQDFNLLAGLTAAENVSLPLELDGVAARPPASRAWRRWTGWASPTRPHRFPDDLSGGERQRVAIARAVVGDRHLLLADEPTGALDSVNGEAVMRLLRAACQRGVAGVVVTHDAQLASWADRVVFLRDGRVVDQTAPLAGSRVAARTRRWTPCEPCRQRAVRRPAGRSCAGRWRLFRREWRQQVLVLALLGFAVAAAVGGASAGVQHGAAPRRRVRHGRPAVRVRRVRAPSADAIDAYLAAAEDWFGTIDVIGHAPRPGAGVDRDPRVPGPGPRRPARRSDAAPAGRPLPGAAQVRWR